MKDTDEHTFFEISLLFFPIVVGKFVLHIDSDILVLMPAVINGALCDLAYQLTYYNKNEANVNVRAILGESWFEKVKFPKTIYKLIVCIETTLICLCITAIISEAIYV